MASGTRIAHAFLVVVGRLIGLRVLHLWVYIPHALWVYVDDGLLLLPSSVAPLISTTSLMFVLALGVPISWEKLQFSSSVSWIGWEFNFLEANVFLPYAKKQKLQVLLQKFMSANQRVERKCVEQVVGLLIWFCGGAPWLKPWLQCFYHLLFKPHCVFRALSPAHFATMRDALDQKLAVDNWALAL